jgi:YbbR domain-containing protein
MKRPWGFSHLGLKLLSLVMALLLWMVVSGEETVERGLRVPLELQQVPAGLELTGDVPTTVDLRVRGPSGTLSRLAAGDIVAVLDLRGATEGRRLFPLTMEQVRVPFGVEVVQVSPPSVAMGFERSATRQVPVVPSVDGHPAPGYIVGPRTADPARVDVIGPESAVKNVTEVLTEPVSVAGARDRVTQTVALGVLDPSLRLKNTRSAAVTVQIMPAPLERVFRNRPIHLRGLASTLEGQATQTVTDVGVRASREALTRLEADHVVAYVDVAGLGPGLYSLSVHADSPPDVGITRIEPSTVQVRISSGRD